MVTRSQLLQESDRKCGGIWPNISTSQDWPHGSLLGNPGSPLFPFMGTRQRFRHNRLGVGTSGFSRFTMNQGHLLSSPIGYRDKSLIKTSHPHKFPDTGWSVPHVCGVHRLAFSTRCLERDEAGIKGYTSRIFMRNTRRRLFFGQTKPPVQILYKTSESTTVRRSSSLPDSTGRPVSGLPPPLLNFFHITSTLVQACLRRQLHCSSLWNNVDRVAREEWITQRGSGTSERGLGVVPPVPSPSKSCPPASGFEAGFQPKRDRGPSSPGWPEIRATYE